MNFSLRQKVGRSMNSFKEVTEMEVWKEKVVQDISDMRQRQRDNENALSTLRNDVHKLQVTVQLQDKEISSLKDTLSEIKDDTNFIRNRLDKDREEQLKQYKSTTWKIIGAIITAGVLAFLGLQ